MDLMKLGAYDEAMIRVQKAQAASAFVYLASLKVFGFSWMLTVGLGLGAAAACRLCARGKSAGSTLSHANMKGKVVVVTGANSGLGYYTALRLAERGATVAISCRTAALLATTKSRLEAEAKCPITIVAEQTMTLDKFDTVREYAAWVASRFPSGVDVLVNNAGMINPANDIQTRYSANTGGKYEIHTAVNFMGPLLLAELLIPALKKAKGRVVNVSSVAHVLCDTRDYADDIISGNRGAAESTGRLFTANGFVRYGISKLLNIATSTWLIQQGVTSVAVHPGVAASNFGAGWLPGWLLDATYYVSLLSVKTAEEGAQTQLYCAVCPEEELVISEGCASKYFADSRDRSTTANAAACNVDDALRVVEWARKELGTA